MGVQFQNNLGNIIAPSDPIAVPDQQVADTSGNIINPAEEHITAISPASTRLSNGISFISSTGTALDVALPTVTGGAETFVRVAFGSIPVSYGVGAQLTTTENRTALFVKNDTNRALVVSLAGTNDNWKVAGSETLAVDNIHIPSGTTIRVRYDSASPANGEVILSAWSRVR